MRQLYMFHEVYNILLVENFVSVDVRLGLFQETTTKWNETLHVYSELRISLTWCMLDYRRSRCYGSFELPWSRRRCLCVLRDAVVIMHCRT